MNLCEGYLEWSIPSIDVIYYMELLSLPFTGPTSLLYDPPKDLMKYVAYTVGVKTPAFALIESLDCLEKRAMRIAKAKQRVEASRRNRMANPFKAQVCSPTRKQSKLIWQAYCQSN